MFLHHASRPLRWGGHWVPGQKPWRKITGTERGIGTGVPIASRGEECTSFEGGGGRYEVVISKCHPLRMAYRLNPQHHHGMGDHVQAGCFMLPRRSAFSTRRFACIAETKTSTWGRGLCVCRLGLKGKT